MDKQTIDAAKWCKTQTRCEECERAEGCFITDCAVSDQIAETAEFYEAREKAIYAKLKKWLSEQETGGCLVIDPLEMWSVLTEMEESE